MKTMTPDTRLKPPDRGGPQRDRGGLAAVVVAILALVLVAGVAVVVVTRHDPPSASGYGSAGDPVTQVTEPAPATTLATLAPAPDAVDFTAVVQGIVQTSNDLRVHPDPGGLLTYMESGNPAYGDALNAQSQLVTGALRYDPAPAAPTVSKVRVVARDQDLAVVNITFATTPRYRVVDRNGQVVSDSPAAVDQSVQWKLHRTGGTWRLVGALSA